MKKALLLVLAILLLFSAASCHSKPQEDVDETATNATTADSSEKTTESAEEGSELPQNLFFGTQDGATEFTVLTQNYHAAITDFVIDETTTNSIEQKVYNRNLKAEQRFGILFRFLDFPYNETNDAIRRLYNDGDSSVDLVSARASWAVLILTEAILGDWNAVPYVDLEKPWWNERSISELTVNGKSFILQGDINPSLISHLSCIYFNKNLVHSYYPEVDIFRLVNDFEWTYDRLYEMVKDVWVSDDSEKGMDDVYGMIAQAEHSMNAFQFSFDLKTTAKTMDGFPILNINTEKWSAAAQKLYTFLYDTSGVYADRSWIDYRNMFAAGKGLFASGVLAHALLGNYANMTDDYAIIPFPMFDDAQDNYYSTTDNSASSVYYIRNIRNPEMVGAVCESLGADSLKNITPEIYEVALKYRYSSSVEQIEMIDFIHNGFTFDFGWIYNSAPRLMNLITTNASSNFVSYQKQNYKAWENRIEEFITYYLESN